MVSPDAAAIVLADDELKMRLVTWVGTEIQRISQKNRLAVFNSLLLKSSGASHSSVSYMKRAFGYTSISDLLFLCGIRGPVHLLSTSSVRGC